MAKRTSKSSLVGRLGKAGRTAFNEHKGDETEYGRGGGLPGGIEAGIARLTECKFKPYNKGEYEGEYFLSLGGTVLQPETVLADDGSGPISVVGLSTNLTRPVCEKTNSSLDQNLARALNELRKLGVETSEVDLDDLEGVAATLKEEQPCFRFRTWKPDPDTEGLYKDKEKQVVHFWDGLCEYEEGEEEDPVDERVEKAATKEKTTKKTKAVDDGPAHEEEEEEEEEEETEVDSDEEILALGEAAESGDADSQARLSDLANIAGVNADEIDTWAEVARALAGKTDSEETEEEEEEEEKVVPAKDEVVRYKANGKKKLAECIVTAVFPRKKTCNLKNLISGVVHKQVSWDQLSE